MTDTARRSWAAVVLFGTGYAVIGIGFAIPGANGVMWRRAARGVCAGIYGAHILYERVRLGHSSRAAAWHVALAVALGAFGLAVGANMRSSIPSASGLRPLLLLSLGIWPVMTALPAYTGALVIGWVLGIALPAPADSASGTDAPRSRSGAFMLAGVILLALSLPPLLLAAREISTDASVRERYTLVARDARMPGGALRAEIDGHTVELLDDHPVKMRAPFANDGARANGMVTVVVDGRRVSTPVPAIIRFNSSDANRYWGYVSLSKLIDRDEGERVVVAENLGGRYRIVSVFPDGNVAEETFEYPARCSPPVRALIIRDVVPYPSGYCSDVLQVWPSIFYPILYPVLSGGAGVICLMVGAVRRR